MGYWPAETFKGKTGKTYIIRHCEVADLDGFLAYQPKLASETRFTLQVPGHPPERENVLKAWQSSLESPVALRVGVFLDNRMVGQLNLWTERVPPHPWTAHVGIFGLGLLQEAWGEGLARRLLDITEVFAKDAGWTRIEGWVRSGNDQAMRLYRRMGYEVEGIRRKAALIEGQYYDQLLISKLLNDNRAWQPPVFETQRLLLRPLQLKDAPAIFEYAKNPNVSQYTLWEPHKTVRDSESFLYEYVLPNYQAGVPEPWGITLKETPEKVIGTVGAFWVSKAAKCMELAYAIDERFWGKGLVVEASRTVLDYVIPTFSLRRMQCRCKVENKASAKVMEKLGMNFEGTLRSSIFSQGRYWDMHYYSLIEGP